MSASASQNSYSELMPFLTDNLNELDIDSSGKIVKKIPSNPSVSDPYKEKQIKDQFVRCVLNCQIPSATGACSANTIEGIRQEVQNLEKVKQQIVYLKKLSESPLAKFLFPDDKAIGDLVNQQKTMQQLFEQSINSTLHQCTTYIDRAPIEQCDDLKALERKLSKLSEDPAFADLNKKLFKSVMELERKQNVQNLSKAIKNQFPDLDVELSKLSQKDRDLFLYSVVKTSSYSYSSFDRPLSKSDWSRLDNYLKVFVAAGKTLDQLHDSKLKEEAKSCLFTMDDVYAGHIDKIFQGWEGHEDMLRGVVSDLNQIKSKKNYIAWDMSAWMKPLAKESGELPEQERRQFIIQTLNLLAKFGDDIPNKLDNEPIAKDTTLMAADINLFKRLNCCWFLRNLACSSSEWARTLDQLSSKVTGFREFEQAICKQPFGVIAQLQPFFEELSMSSPQVAQKGLSVLIAWYSKAPSNFLKKDQLLFQRRPVESLIDDIEKLNEIFEQCGGSTDKIEEHFRLNPSDLYEEAFKFTENPNFWKGCQQTLEKHPSVQATFEKWADRMLASQVSGKNTWAQDVQQSRPEFKLLLAKLFAIEKQDPDLFEQIIRTLEYDRTSRVLSILINLNDYFDKANLKSLLQLIKSDPTLIPFLPKSFKPNEYKSIDRPFDSDATKLAQRISRIDPKTLTFMIKESHHPRKLNDMLETYDQEPSKMRKIVEIETSSDKPVIWKKGIVDSSVSLMEIYKGFDLKILDILSTYPNVRQAVAEKGVQHIPWDEIPDEIWKIDSQLPFKLLDLREKLRNEDPAISILSSSTSIRPLLADVVAHGKNGAAYSLLELQASTYRAFTAISRIVELKGGEPANACVGIMAEPGKGVTPELDFLKLQPWVDSIVPVIDRLGILYGIKAEGSYEHRLQQLPIRWKGALLHIWSVGLQNPDVVKDLCAFAAKHPQIGLMEKLLTSLDQIKSDDQSNMVAAFDRFPEQLSKAYDPDELRIFINLFESKFPHNLNDLTYLLHMPEQFNVIKRILNSKPEQLLKMIEWDKRLGPPAGRIMFEFIDVKTLSRLETDPAFANAAKIAGLVHVDSTFMVDFGNAYSYLLQALEGRYGPNYYEADNLSNHPILKKIRENGACLKAVKEIDWSKVSNPKRFANHVLTIASWNQVDSLTKLLEWIKVNDYAKGENLLDLAKAGYLPEALQIIEKYQADPTNPNIISLLNMTGSQNALEIQRILQNGPPPFVKPIPLVPRADALAAVNAIQVRIENLKKQTFNSDEDRNRAIETAYSFAVAEQLVSASGHIDNALIPEILKYIRSQKDFPTDSDFGIYLQTTLDHIDKDPEFSHVLSSIEMTSDGNSPAALMVRRMFDLKATDTLTHRHALIAALSAILSRPRQSRGVGSCFGTAWVIISQSDSAKLKQSLEDYKALLKSNCLVRKARGKAQGYYSYPLSILQKRMQEPVLFENLLLKGREIALSNMGANAQYTGLIEKNLKYFDENGPFENWINNPDSIAVVPPLQTNLLLDEMRIAFNQTVKSVIQFEEPHPINQKFGWSRLERRDKTEPIDSLDKYIQMHIDVIEVAQRKMQTQFPQHKVYLERVFESLKEHVKEPEFAINAIPGSEYGIQLDKLERTNWMSDSGGNPKAVIAADLQFESINMPYATYFSSSPSGLLALLCDACQSMPAVEKDLCMREPNHLHPLTIPSHALCLRPSMLIGKNFDAMHARLAKPSGVKMTDIPEPERKKWMEEWINNLPYSLQVPFKNEISTLQWESMTLEECGKAMRDSYVKIFGVSPDFKTLVDMEKQFFKILPPEIQRKLEVQIVGDLNWDEGNYNNCHLACSRSPLTGELAWYKCSRAGDARKPLWWNVHQSEWEIMEPISRTINGSVSYK